ncbi:hypothetical protein [Streptomyces sp. NPDC088554]|uniref:hypothetical protein n=1 Tax=Streptomyces sp. NPDC088554 TaxID=3365865 RepID=UPI0038280C15
MFLFLLIAMVVVVSAVTLAVVGGGDRAILPEVSPERLVDPLPVTRPVGRADVEALRLPVGARGYRMADVDDVLARLGAELAERDARIAELESALAGAQATAVSPAGFFGKPGTRELFGGREDLGPDDLGPEDFERPVDLGKSGDVEEPGDSGGPGGSGKAGDSGKPGEETGR